MDVLEVSYASWCRRTLCSRGCRVVYFALESTTRLIVITPTGICVFSVWMFYDESLPLAVENCRCHCVMENVLSTSDNPRCRTTAVSNYANGKGNCHREDFAAVRRFTVGDLLLLFAGYWEGCVERCRVRVRVTRTSGLPTNLFERVEQSAVCHGSFHVVQRYHAWVDDTGLYKRPHWRL